MLIQRAVLLDGTPTDIRVDERIVDVGELVPHKGEQVLDAAGGTVIPGLHDHHVHLRSAAAALTSARVGPAEVKGREDLARALADAVVGSDGWIRAVGYHEAAAGPLDRDVLDEVSPPVPVRVQHRSGVLWTLNSKGLARVGLTDHPDGRMRSADRSWSDTLQRDESGLAEVSRLLSEYGVTAVTDATPDFEVSDIVKLIEAHRRGELRQRVHCLAPGKRILHDGDLDLAELSGWIANRHAAAEGNAGSAEARCQEGCTEAEACANEACANGPGADGTACNAGLGARNASGDEFRRGIIGNVVSAGKQLGAYQPL